MEKSVNSMLKNLALSDAHFKHQQRNEPDLTIEEKYKIAEEIFGQSHSKFLARFYKFLSLEDIICFSESSQDYEVNFYIQEIKVLSDKKLCSVKVKNRRLEAMAKLLKDGYFSEENMQLRNPLLYEQYIGQYLSADEKEEMRKNAMKQSDLRLSSIILDHMDYQECQEKVNATKQSMQSAKFYSSSNSEHFGYIPSNSCVANAVNNCENEDDDNSVCSDESEIESDSEASCTKIVIHKNIAKSTKQQISVTSTSFDKNERLRDKEDMKIPSDEEKLRLRQEFLECMQQNFLDGKDSDFDYSSVDNNEQYDNTKILQEDAEDKYFENE